MPVTNRRLAPVEAHEPLDRIGRDALVGVADMRRAIGVRDRRGDEEAAHERPLKQKFLSGDENLSVSSASRLAVRHPHPEEPRASAASRRMIQQAATSPL